MKAIRQCGQVSAQINFVHTSKYNRVEPHYYVAILKFKFVGLAEEGPRTETFYAVVRSA